MNECNNNDDTSDRFTVDSYNCDSDAICPFASLYRSTIDTEYFDCARYNNITLNQTLVDQYQGSDSNIETHTLAMNVCDNNGSVYTCDGNTIYQWMYNDAQCTDYNDYEIYVANSLDCQYWTLLSYPAKNIVDQCVMTSSPTNAPTASPPTYDPPTNDPTAAPSTNGTTSSTTKYTRPLTTAASKYANLLSTMVNLVALLIVCICVIIQ